MNERIRELCIQSGAYEHYEVNEGVNGDELPMQRFAELIVRECAELAREWEDDYVVEDTAPFYSDVKIKQHFAVE